MISSCTPIASPSPPLPAAASRASPVSSAAPAGTWATCPAPRWRVPSAPPMPRRRRPLPAHKKSSRVRPRPSPCAARPATSPMPTAARAFAYLNNAAIAAEMLRRGAKMKSIQRYSAIAGRGDLNRRPPLIATNCKTGAHFRRGLCLSGTNPRARQPPRFLICPYPAAFSQVVMGLRTGIGKTPSGPHRTPIPRAG